jgi:urea transporter
VATLKTLPLTAADDEAFASLSVSGRASGALERASLMLDPLLTSFAQVVGSRRRTVGCVVAAAAATEPNALALGLCALLGCSLSVKQLRLPRAYVPYGYNALLVGILIGRAYTLSPTAAGFALVLGGLSVLATASLTALSGHAGFMPVLALPFVLTAWFASGVALHLPLQAQPPQLDPLTGLLPPYAAEVLQSLGAMLGTPNSIAGALLALALLVHSRIASLLAAGALLGVLLVLQLAHAPLSSLLVQAVGANAVLTATALGGVWLLPSRGASLLALAGAWSAAFITLGCVLPLARLGLFPALLPFSATVILILSALRQRSQDSVLQLAELAADTPEQLLLDHMARVPDAAAPLRVSPPFLGAWICTQGVDGPYTHRGIFRHAFDFEIYWEGDGSLCRGNGARPEDYYCFAQPVLAVADGSVVAVESRVPNNIVGDANAQEPWGNYVLLQHAGGVCSLVAHLSPGSVTVYPGQYLVRGSVVGYCGNSGYSPRPHIHFQLQAGPQLGAATLPCRFSDLLVTTPQARRFHALHTPAQGEAVSALTPDFALASLFDLPLGAALTYRVDGRLERIVCELDGWGRSVLRSLDRPAQLVFARALSRFCCGELSGDPRSVLRLLRVTLAEVPFERHPMLSFRSHIPARWLARGWRALLWDVQAALAEARAIELESRIEVEGDMLVIVGSSARVDKNGRPLLATRARLGRGGPLSLEVTQAGRTVRAELVTDVHAPRRALAPGEERSASPFALGVGDWS